MKFSRVWLAHLALVAVRYELPGQTLLQLPPTYCSYSGAEIRERVFYFPPGEDVVTTVDQITGAMARGTNFSLAAANVPDTTSIVDKNLRVILYNQQLTAQTAAAQLNWGMRLALAHQVGHHINHHLLTSASHRRTEELDADGFAGYLLHVLGATRAEIEGILAVMQFQSGRKGYPAAAERIKATLQGWDQAGQEALPNFAPDASVPRLEVWPPPKASAWTDLPRQSVVRNRVDLTLADVAATLESALAKAGYSERSYHSIPGGFALASRVEQITETGVPRAGDERWSIALPRVFSIGEYLRALFKGLPGYYRVLLFVVTDEPFAQSTKGPDVDAALDWAWSGNSRLPASVAQRKFTKTHNCTALVYEFQRSDQQSAAILRVPGALSGRLHLERAGVWNVLAN
jgi:hypothetical protein